MIMYIHEIEFSKHSEIEISIFLFVNHIKVSLNIFVCNKTKILGELITKTQA